LVVGNGIFLTNDSLLTVKELMHKSLVCDKKVREMNFCIANFSNILKPISNAYSAFLELDRMIAVW
jgi:hypothetical protein